MRDFVALLEDLYYQDKRNSTNGVNYTRSTIYFTFIVKITKEKLFMEIFKEWVKKALGVTFSTHGFRACMKLLNEIVCFLGKRSVNSTFLKRVAIVIK